MDDADGSTTRGGPISSRITGVRLLATVAILAAAVASSVVASPSGVASAAGRPQARGFAGASSVLAGSSAVQQAVSPHVAGTSAQSPATQRAQTYGPICSYDGLPSGNVVSNVSAGTVIAISCTGWLPNEPVYAAEISPLFFATGSVDDADVTNQQSYETSATGTLMGNFTVPTFTATDPAAVCPPTADQIANGYYRCVVALVDNGSGPPGYVGGNLVGLQYTTGATPPPAPTAVGIASTPDGGGYWVAWSDGFVIPHGNAGSFGDASNLNLTAPITHVVATPDGGGYWLVAGDGGTFAYGDAGFYGSMGATQLNKPVVDLAPTVDGKGYWLVASDGGIFAFGDAGFHGSMGGQVLNQPVVGIAADTTTGGYWEVASDGGIFAFGAPFDGSTGSIHLAKPINGMTATATDLGYLFVAADGGVFAFGDAGFHGSAGNLILNAPVVGMALDPATGGYWLVGADGGIFSYSVPFYGAG